MSKTLLLIVLCCLLGGCQNDAADKETPRPTMSDTEIARGRKACGSYVERICACAKDDENQAGECELAKGRPEALELALRSIAAAANRSKADQWALDQNARRIVEQCIKADLELDPQRCPR